MSGKKYKIEIQSGSVKHDHLCNLTLQEAYEYGTEHRWEFTDENGFTWEMHLREDD